MLLASLMWVVPQPAQAKPKQSIVNKQVSIVTSIVNTPKQSNPQVDEHVSKTRILGEEPRATKHKDDRQNLLRTTVGKNSKSSPSRLGYSGKTYTKEEVENLIRRYSEQYGISSDTPRCIAFHESGYNQFSKNKRSSASGVFQYLANSTWKATDEGKAGLSVFDADANVRAAVKYMSIHRSTKPWTTRTSCPPLKFNH